MYPSCERGATETSEWSRLNLCIGKAGKGLTPRVPPAGARVNQNNFDKPFLTCIW